MADKKPKAMQKKAKIRKHGGKIMFRELRRKRQELPLQESIDILMKGTSGVLALSGDEGYPYAVPISYVYRDSKLYFHGAKSGHKIVSESPFSADIQNTGSAVHSNPSGSCGAWDDRTRPLHYR